MNKNHEMFNLYYQKAMQDKESGALESCSKNLRKAAEYMLILAKEASGQTKKTQFDRAMNLVKLAEKIEKEIIENRKNNVEVAPSQNNRSNASSSSSRRSSRQEPNKEDNDGGTIFEASQIPDISFDDVAGLEEVKEAVQERILMPVKYREQYELAGVSGGGGILMYGLPGTGKTLIAKAIAHEVGASFYSVKCSDIVSKWFGEAEKNIRSLFETARQNDRAVIFFDEFESIAVKRGGNSTVMNRIVPELLTQIQGFSDNKCMLLILAATNRPWDIDSAMLRPGRFNELLYIPLPDYEARKKIAQLRLKDQTLLDFNYDDIAIETEGYNGADVSNVCDKIKLELFKELVAQKSEVKLPITRDMFDKVLQTAKSTVTESDKKNLDKFEQNIGKI